MMEVIFEAKACWRVKASFQLSNRDFWTYFRVSWKNPDFNLPTGTALAEFYLGHRLSFTHGFYTADPEIVLSISYQVQDKCTANQPGIIVSRWFDSCVEIIKPSLLRLTTSSQSQSVRRKV
ncbi:MAG: hypothetical protein A2Z16_14285 [Chloroflexi bacterium RBG_16_54_18]|nr:MAG: hypothetical protein A2Z16_14285 [Chloroflexi bacterium RBG_16_54_18]